MVIHFETQEERLRYLKGEFEEIIPEEVKEEKPKKKRRKKDEVQAEQS